MILNIIETIFHGVSRIEFTNLSDRLSQLEVTDDDHFECENSLQYQVLRLEDKIRELKRTLTEVTKICLTVVTFLSTTYYQPVGTEEINTLTAALNRLTIRELDQDKEANVL